MPHAGVFRRFQRGQGATPEDPTMAGGLAAAAEEAAGGSSGGGGGSPPEAADPRALAKKAKIDALWKQMRGAPAGGTAGGTAAAARAAAAPLGAAAATPAAAAVGAANGSSRSHPPVGALNLAALCRGARRQDASSDLVRVTWCV